MCKNILVVDDSALMRRVISDIINSDGRFRVTKVARDGLEALKILIKEEGKFDAMMLDINMARMDGLETLSEIKKLNIDIKVIVLSTLTDEGGGVTIEALARGAFDFIKKPSDVADMEDGAFKRKIINCLLVATEEYESSVYMKGNKNIYQKKTAKKNINIIEKKIVFCACSTGGPNALQKVVPKISEKIDAPIVIVQHMPEGFTKSLADRLNELSKLRVKEAEKGDILEKGTVYIAKGGSQLILKENSKGKAYCDICDRKDVVLKPCADVTLNSIKNLAYNKVICVVLTGMGSDATKGILELSKNKEIYVIAQDKETSVVYGMPNVIKDTGLVNEIVALEDVARTIINNTGVR